MGYLHDVDLKWVLQAEGMLVSAGSWSDVVSGNIWCRRRAAASGSFKIYLPLRLWQNARAKQGMCLKTVEVWYSLASASPSLFNVFVYKASLPQDGSPFSSAVEEAFTYDANHDSTGQRAALGNHKMTLTLSTPFWLGSEQAIWVHIGITPASSTLFEYYAARVSFTLRV